MKPVAYRQWSTKFHCWDYEDARGDLRPDAEVDALVLQSDAQMLLEAAIAVVAAVEDQIGSGWSDEQIYDMTSVALSTAYFKARDAIAATGQQPDLHGVGQVWSDFPGSEASHG